LKAVALAWGSLRDAVGVPVFGRGMAPARSYPVWAGAGLILIGLVLSVGMSARWAHLSSLQSLHQSSQHTASFHALALHDLVQRHEHIPFVVANDSRMREVFGERKEKVAAELNVYLEKLARASGALDLYVMDERGITLAASNWSEPRSFVGRNYGFRPYFQDAMLGATGRFYGIGTTSNRAGYYLSHPIEVDGAIRGVAVIKIDLQGLETTWAADGAVTMLADSHGVVFLSSVPELRFRTLAPLDAPARSAIDLTRQYEGASLQAMPMAAAGPARDGIRLVRAELPTGAEHLLLELRSSRLPHDWRLVMLADTGPVATQTRSVGAAVGLGYLALVMFGLFWLQRRRRIRDNLTAKADLECAHRQLEAKVEERTRELRNAQDDLVQTGKLALLGQLSASIAHEINQPLAALRTFSDNSIKLAELGRMDELRENLVTIGELTTRVGSITSQLKNFSRRTPPRIETVDVRVAIQNSLMLTSERMRLEGIALTTRLPAQDLHALCELIRLEQVLVNLLCNAADAVGGLSERRVEIGARSEGAEVVVEVCDSGCGIPEDIGERLFEPFVSSKESGLGLGLAISAAMVQAWRGKLAAARLPGGGTRFSVRLRATPAG